MKAERLLALLEEKSNATRKNIYECIVLAAKVLEDREWTAEKFGGSYDKALEYLDQKYFPWCSDIGLETLLDIYRHFPRESEWSSRKYHIKHMYAEWMDSRAEEEREQRQRKTKSWKKDAMVLEEKAKELEAEVKKQAEVTRKAMSERDKLLARIAQLEEENAVLRGRLEEMERIMDRRLVAAG